jgi:hypothetical protein
MIALTQTQQKIHEPQRQRTCVDDGLLLEGVHGGLGKGGHEAELDAGLLQHVVLVLGAELHQVAARGSQHKESKHKQSNNKNTHTHTHTHTHKRARKQELLSRIFPQTNLMSISLKVVSMAAVFCESLRRSAVRMRMRVIFTCSGGSVLWREAGEMGCKS